MNSSTLTYCGNVHPVRLLDDLIGVLGREARAVASGVDPEQASPFPLGLWLPASALDEALSPAGLEKLREALLRGSFRVATLNAFPYGVFHGAGVKTGVYRPDWAEPARLEYTWKLAKLARELIGAGGEVTLSSLSGGFRPLDTPAKRAAYIDHFLEFVSRADHMKKESGFCVRLALEPEPFNTLQDEEDAVGSFGEIWSVAERAGLAREVVSQHLGLCFDTCHFSVRYRDLMRAWRRLAAAGVPVYKIQVSAAPRWRPGIADFSRADFFALDEPVYLHQSYARDAAGKIHAFADLPEARSAGVEAVEWRTHFHIPIHLAQLEQTTGAELRIFLRTLAAEKSVQLYEIETYSFAALKSPAFSKKPSLIESLVQEFAWLRDQLHT